MSGTAAEGARATAIVNPYKAIPTAYKTRGESAAAAGTKRKVPEYMEYA
jgi:hypothetical protein